ncbi:MAG: hypothetical protein WBO17_04715, partial [Sphingorhabdus sp.]
EVGLPPTLHKECAIQSRRDFISGPALASASVPLIGCGTGNMTDFQLAAEMLRNPIIENPKVRAMLAVRKPGR